MDELKKRISDNVDFVDQTREIMTKINEALSALHCLMEKQEARNPGGNVVASNTNAGFEKDLQELVRRHLSLDPTDQKITLNEEVTSHFQTKPSTPRPGRYRPLV